MSHILKSLTEIEALPFDTIIDARSPSEFAEDHIPGAINLPVLSDEERAEVGTIYVQDDPFKARKIGAALVSRNVATYLEGPLAHHDGGWKPLVYCWRGGQRSGSFAAILGQIGWRSETLSGGYKSYRRLVVKALYEDPVSLELVLIDGGTGTGKTRLLHQLAERGAQVIDLEGLAGHRGSLFGDVMDGQPAQKRFESGLASKLTAFDPERPVFLEAESNKIGERIVPPSLWKAMCEARRIRIEAPLPARVAFLRRCYSDLTEDRARLVSIIERLRPYHSADQVGLWRKQALEGAFSPLAEGLITAHYDPRYARSISRDGSQARTVDLPDVTDDSLARAADEIIGFEVRKR